LVRVTRFELPGSYYPCGQVVALVNIENRVLAHHRDNARCRGIVRAFVANLKLFDETHFGAAFALAGIPGLDSTRSISRNGFSDTAIDADERASK
jgi:hypothetical protein